jgi:hypothetical protein
MLNVGCWMFLPFACHAPNLTPSTRSSPLAARCGRSARPSTCRTRRARLRPVAAEILRARYVSPAARGTWGIRKVTPPPTSSAGIRGCAGSRAAPDGRDLHLPAEQHAIKTGSTPRWRRRRTATFAPAQRLGWRLAARGQYRPGLLLTQWIFLQLYHSWFNPDTQRAEPIFSQLYRQRSRQRPPRLRLRSARELVPGAGTVQ